MHSQVEFQADVLHFSATHRARSGDSRDSRESMVVKARTIALLKDSVNHPAKHSSDENIVSVTALAAQEVSLAILVLHVYMLRTLTHNMSTVTFRQQGHITDPYPRYDANDPQQRRAHGIVR
jgi:hypothetical protein